MAYFAFSIIVVIEIEIEILNFQILIKTSFENHLKIFTMVVNFGCMCHVQYQHLSAVILRRYIFDIIDNLVSIFAVNNNKKIYNYISTKFDNKLDTMQKHTISTSSIRWIFEGILRGNDKESFYNFFLLNQIQFIFIVPLMLSMTYNHNWPNNRLCILLNPQPKITSWYKEWMNESPDLV